MKKLVKTLFSNHFFAERILFLSVAGGTLIDGWLTSVFSNASTEVFLRIGISLISGFSFLFTYSGKASKENIRGFAYCAIFLLLSFSAYLCVIHHFNNDNALTFLGAYVICSLYFISVRELISYLLFGFLLACLAVSITADPQITTQLFIFRLFLGALLVLGLSFATRKFQQRLNLFSRKMAEENLSLNQTRIALEERLTHEHLLAMVASRANTVVIISGPDDIIEWVNEGFTKITGYSATDAIGKKTDFLRGPGTDPLDSTRIDEKKNKGIAFNDTILNFKKNGNPIWMQMHVTPLMDEQGKIEKYIAIQEDISEIKATEEELRRSRELLKTAQSQAKIGSWEWTAGSEFVFCSDEMIRILGVQEEKSVLLQFIMDRVHPGDLSVMKKTIENGLLRSSPFEIDFRLVINGIVKYAYLTGQALSSKEGRTEMLFGTLQDITERKQIENEMRIAEKQYRSLFEHSQHMICIHDLQGNILSINPAGAHAVGHEPEEIIGRNIKLFFWNNNSEEFEKYIHTIEHNGQAQGLLSIRFGAEHSSVWLYNNILLADPEGTPYVLSSNVEITGRYEMEKELRAAKKIAEEALVMKDRFVANISHELRTPMNAIIGFSDLLIKTKLNPEQMEYLQAIHIAGDNLTSMINDILDLAKIESGTIEFEVKPFSIRNVMSNTHRLLSQSAAQSKLNFEWKCDDTIPAYVQGDELRLTQVLINLVGNALKFTEKGFVQFSCSIKEQTDESIDLEFIVEDSGVGVPAEKQKVIFDPFIQASTESTRRFGGTGLGLSIVRDLVELQGGTVSLKSTVGSGSVFTVVLPVKKVGVEIIQAVEKALFPIDSPENIRILLVEDQPLNQKLAKKLISDFGFTSELAFNGKEALEILQNAKFDIVLMDLQMPEMDGYESTQNIREKLMLDIPIVALTAHSSTGERERCLTIGMNDYLVKPFRAQELYYKIVSNIHKKVNGVQPKETEKFEENPLRTLAGGDLKFEREIIEMLIKSIPEDIEAMKKSVLEKDFPSARAIAHRSKSSVALAGEKEFSALLEECEKSCSSGLNPEKIDDKLNELNRRKEILIDSLQKRLSEIREQTINDTSR